MEFPGLRDLTAGKKILAENFANWTSGNEIIDNFIQEKQLDYRNFDKAVFEWIPYNELIGIKEIGKGCFATAIWKKGPLFHYKNENEWVKKSYEFVTLKFLYDIQHITDELNKIESYSKYDVIVFGISQNPDTEVYLLVFNDICFDRYCKKCGNEYDNICYKWCKECQINQLKNDFTNWTSGNIKLDDFIQKMQLKIYEYNILFEWIPYNEFIIIEGLENYTLAIWKKDSLYYDKMYNKLERRSNKKVYLKSLYNSQEITDEFLHEIESYLKNNEIFGISQNPDTEVYLLVFNDIYFGHYCERCGNKYDNSFNIWCKECQINQLKNDFTNWTSGNIKIDDFIQKRQLKIMNYDDTIFKWIPYNEFIIIEELEHYTSAIWKKGPLYYDKKDKKLIRKSNEKVYLKYLYNSQEITDEFSNEVESYLKNKEIFGISQNPDTKVYILVFYNEYLIHYCEKCGNKYDDEEYKRRKWCKKCQINQLKNDFTNWTSGNIKLDDFIQKMQLKFNIQSRTFEWISYNEFIIIKELEYYTLAIWEKGPLYYNKYDKKLVRKSNEKVYLKSLYNSQEITDEFSNEVESYLKNDVILGISQNPDTEVYLFVFNDIYFNYYCEKCGNEYDNSSYKWSTAIWKDGPLYYSSIRRSYDREINKKVILKYLCNSQNVSHLFLSEVIYSVEENYGITQNLNTKDYMLVCKIEYYCENCGKKYNNQFEINNKICISCQTNHENKKINDLIQEIKLNIDRDVKQNDIMFEWIPYAQFNDIKEIGKGGFSTVYLAIWKDGLLSYHSGWRRQPNTKVALKCLNNSQNFLDEFINEVKAYTNQKIDNILKIYGISQNTNTKEYIMVLEYAEGDFNSYLKDKCEDFDWYNGLSMLTIAIEDNRPNSIELKESIDLFYNSLYRLNQHFEISIEKEQLVDREIEKQFNKTQEYRKENFLSIKNNQLTSHTQAIYTSRLLNSFTKDLPKYEDNFNSNTVEITDFTNL
ncbi:uncharacterized protein OCT59_029176 [Rhizophagus irregularis]|uniref:uncharacterized protein n=1 Tax=Rhizophagus irregularis TaxID=588596 RepID=UPI00331D06B8|nr:hypothetical protein OCT59_029176 [Rhizophagus irregularis]